MIRSNSWPLAAPLALILLLAAATATAEFQYQVTEPVYPDAYYPQVRFETSAGAFVVELDRRRAPVTVNSFLAYVESGAWVGTVFHRVVPDFVVQGGGYSAEFDPIDTNDPLMNESGNGLPNRKRSIAMARHDDPHSATSQFYFNLADNESLDPNRRNWGYTVFGSVIEGWEVIEGIGGVQTGYSELLGSGDVPIEPIVIEAVNLVTE